MERDTINKNLMRRRCAGDILKRTSLRVPEKTALVFQEKRISYAELNIYVNRLANSLLELGIKKGDKVSVITQNCHQMVIIMWACLKIGAIYSPASFLLKENEIIYQMNHSEAKILFVESKFVPVVNSIKKKLETIQYFGIINLEKINVPEGWLDVELLISEKYSQKEPEVVVTGDDPSTLVYTGGTTAAPKGVLWSHDGYYSFTANFNCSSGGWIEENDVYLCNIPLYHTGGICMLSSFLRVGAKIIITYGTNYQEMLKLIQQEKINFLAWPPTIYNGLLKMPLHDYDLSSLYKCWWFGGSMPLNTIKQLKKLFPRLKFGGHWSQSEITGTGTMAWWDGFPPAGNVIGKPLPDTEIKIVDDDKEVKTGEIGEIVVRSPSVMLGYYKNEEKNQEVFKNGWLHTGDMGMVDENGYFYFIDRKGDIIKTGGENVSCLEGEEVLNSHPDIEISAVFGAPHDYWIEAVTAVVVSKSGQLSEEEVIKYCKKNLSAYKVPKKIIFIEHNQLPVSSSGKILRRELRSTYKDVYKDTETVG